MTETTNDCYCLPGCIQGCGFGGGEVRRCEDPADVNNSARYHTGKPCIEDGCELPAGTAWSPHWCQKHNAERMERITKSLLDGLAKLEAKESKP